MYLKMRGRQKNTVMAVGGLIAVPIMWIILFSGQEITSEDILEHRLTELRDRLEHAEYMSREREGDAHVLHSQLDVLIQAQAEMHATTNSTNQGVIFGKETRQLVANLTIGSSDIQPPGIYHYLPHIIGKPQALTPQNKVSKGRMGVSLVLGIPHIKRPHESYLLQTLKSLVESLSQSERRDCLIVVFIAEPDDINYIKDVTHKISQSLNWAVRTGLVEIISASKEFYPNLSDVKESFGDNKDRVKWRTKQNLDYSFLMMYAKSRGTYYVQLEDDVVTKPGYLSTIKNFATHQVSTEWILLEFSTLGFIGKLFKTSDLPTIVEFFLMFYKDKPIDWLLHYYLSVKVCNPERDDRHCDRSIAEVRRRFKPSLFQHIGTHSSLKGKVQKLKDKDFGKIAIHRANVNPIADVSTSIKVYQHFTLDRAYIGDSHFWGTIPNANDVLVFKFIPPITLERYYFQSGNNDHPGDKFTNTTVEVLPVNPVKVDDSDVRTRFKMTEDKYLIIGEFNADGVAEGQVSLSMGTIDSLRLRVLQPGQNWVLLNEILIKGAATLR